VEEICLTDRLVEETCLIDGWVEEIRLIGGRNTVYLTDRMVGDITC